MSIDYGERERQFLDTLKADTGRTLEDWLAAIAAEGLTHRNDIIDWLRRQGFMFSKASWIERIHNNGGRPIYAETGAPRARRSRAAPQHRPPFLVVADTLPATAAATPTAVAPPPPAAPNPPAEPKSTAEKEDPAALDALLARAKAFRPLAVYVVAEIRKALPDSVLSLRDGYLVFRLRDADFALLAISAKELRLGLNLATPPTGVAFEAPRFPSARGAPAMSHMIVLTDARQITPALVAAVVEAASRT